MTGENMRTRYVYLACGHGQRVALYGTPEERERQAETWVKNRLCAECAGPAEERAADREETTEEAEERTRIAESLIRRRAKRLSASRFLEGYFPPNEVRDTDKLRTLVESMEHAGWQGPPLVAHGAQLLTGSHRYFAVRELRDRYGDDDVGGHMTIPVVEAEELFDAAGLDFGALRDKYDEEMAGEPAWEIYRRALDDLPATYHDYFGLDMG